MLWLGRFSTSRTIKRIWKDICNTLAYVSGVECYWVTILSYIIGLLVHHGASFQHDARWNFVCSLLAVDTIIFLSYLWTHSNDCWLVFRLMVLDHIIDLLFIWNHTIFWLLLSTEVKILTDVHILLKTILLIIIDIYFCIFFVVFIHKWTLRWHLRDKFRLFLFVRGNRTWN